jgi:hypothetical protein
MARPSTLASPHSPGDWLVSRTNELTGFLGCFWSIYIYIYIYTVSQQKSKISCFGLHILERLDCIACRFRPMDVFLRGDFTIGS